MLDTVIKNAELADFFSIGTAVTLVKLRNLRGETLIYEDKMTLAGIIGHEIANKKYSS